MNRTALPVGKLERAGNLAAPQENNREISPRPYGSTGEPVQGIEPKSIFRGPIRVFRVNRRLRVEIRGALAQGLVTISTIQGISIETLLLGYLTQGKPADSNGSQGADAKSNTLRQSRSPWVPPGQGRNPTKAGEVEFPFVPVGQQLRVRGSR